MSSAAKISVFIPVKNEEENLPGCLESLEWADEVFVVDSQSSDRTVETAERLGAKVYQFHFDGSMKKDDWALEKLPFRNEWVFYIDADERVPTELAEEILRTIQDGDAKDGYYVNRRLIFMGRWLRHAGLYPSWSLRLFKQCRGGGERRARRYKSFRLIRGRECDRWNGGRRPVGV